MRKFDRSALHIEAAKALDARGKQLLSRATTRPIQPRQPEAFPTRREIETITDKDIISISQMSYADITGRTQARYFVKNMNEIGLFDDGYHELRKLVELIISKKPFDTGFSQKFIEECVFKWWVSQHQNEAPISLSDSLFNEAEKAFRHHHMIVPIAGLEIERPFRIGVIQVAPMDKAMLGRFGLGAIKNNPESAEIIRKESQRIQKELGHLTAVHIEIEGEPEFAATHAKDIAFRVSEMFRFMSPAAPSWNVAFPCFPHGCYEPRSTTVITVEDNDIALMTTSVLEFGMFSWRQSFIELDRDMKAGFLNFSVYFQDEPLTPFQNRLGKAISAFTQGTATHDTSNRLIYTMSALEHLFLRDQSEPIQAGVSERIAFFISKDPDQRRKIVANFKKAYALRSKQIHHLSSLVDEEIMAEFFRNAWIAMFSALKNIKRFKNSEDFLDAIDNVKFGVT